MFLGLLGALKFAIAAIKIADRSTACRAAREPEILEAGLILIAAISIVWAGNTIDLIGEHACSLCLLP